MVQEQWGRSTHRLAVFLMKENSLIRICVPVCERRASDLASAIIRAAEVADIIELRLDCLEEGQLQTFLHGAELGALLQARLRTFIQTFRPAEQGGHRALELQDRYAFWLSLDNSPKLDFVDWELDLSLLFASREPSLVLPHEWERVICSHHDFTGVPTNLEEIYQRMASTPARTLKIAVQANEITDCLPVFRLLDCAQREGREMIAIAMGEAGIPTRILGPSRGAFLTYGSLDAEHATAPGQISATDLRRLYRIDQINQQTEIMGLVGSPVRHSMSPQMHNAAFATCNVNAVYLPFAVSDVSQFIRRMVHPRSREMEWRLRGLSVTAPHKSAIMEHLDWIEPAAREIGAVNTVVIKDDALRGYNTDAAALLTPLLNRFRSLQDARCALIGAGGAARGALWSLRQAGASVTVFARNAERALPLAERFGVRCEQLDGALFDGFAVVINATPLGTRGPGEDKTPAVASQLRGARLAYDLVYNPLETRFMHEAREAGCETMGGLAMLVAQAAEQFKLWTNMDAPVEVMQQAAELAISSQ